MSKFKVFLSAVSSEFEHARTHAANDLVAKGLEVKVQENFRQEVDSITTLELLHNYIRDCNAVVCLVGARSGDFPPDAAALPYAHILPAGITRASYTQWEYFFARHYKKRCSMYWSKGYPPERDALATDDPTVQATYGQWLRDQGLYKNYFDSIDALCRQVNKEDWPNHARPPANNLPYPSLGTRFVGRDAFMQQLRASIEAHAQAVIKPRHAIHGLGGIGKTRLATEYAWQHKEHYSALLFVMAETPEALRRNLAALCDPLVLDLPEQNASEEERKVASALAWLQQHDRWFLLVDNVDTPEAVAEAERLLGRLSTGHVVYTSRITNWAGHVQPLELDVLDQAISVRFILDRTAQRRRKQPNDDEQAALIAQDVDGLALALEQASAYINAQRLSLADYRTHWQQKHDAVMNWYDPAAMNYPKCVAITWQTSMDQLSADAKQLLMRLSWLSPEPIPESLLDVKAGDGDTLDARAVLAELEKYSLVSLSNEGPYFSVHRLVQDVGRIAQMNEPLPKAYAAAANWLNNAFTGHPQDVGIYGRVNEIYSHALAVGLSEQAPLLGDPTPRLLSFVGGFLFYGKALYADAEPLFRRSLSIVESIVGLKNPAVATNLNNLAQLLKATNRLAEAEPLLRRALVIDETSYGPEHPEVAIDLSNLALLLQDTNRLAEAEPLLRRALAINVNSLGSVHPYVAKNLSNLAVLLKDTNRLSEAEQLARQALVIYEVNFTPDHPEIARVLSILASLHQATNRLPDAELLSRRALSIVEISYGPNHPNIATHLNNLAHLLYTTNRYDEAEPLMRRALAIDEESYGPVHPNVAIRMNNLARLLQATNRLTEAEPLMRSHLSIFLQFQNYNGYAHPLLSSAVKNYKHVLNAIGKSDLEVEEEMRKLHKEATGQKQGI